MLFRTHFEPKYLLGNGTVVKCSVIISSIIHDDSTLVSHTDIDTTGDVSTKSDKQLLAQWAEKCPKCAEKVVFKGLNVSLQNKI